MKIGEFLGLPRAGKTQTSEALDRMLRDRDYYIRLITDQIKEVPMPSDQLEKNRWSTWKIGNLITEALGQDYDSILIDRGGWAHWISVESLIRANLVKDIDKARRIQEIAMDIVKDENFFILIEVSVAKAIERHDGLGGTLNGVVMNEIVLNQMKEINQEIKEKLPKERSLIINGEKEFLKNLKEILDFVLSMLDDQEGGKNGIYPQEPDCPKIISPKRGDNCYGSKIGGRLFSF